MTSFTWKTNVKVLEQDDEFGNSDSITNIHWRYNAAADDATPENDLYATTYGSVRISATENTVFIPIDEITQEKVIEWVLNNNAAKEKLNAEVYLEKIQATLNAQIDKKRTPTTRTVTIEQGVF